MRTIAIMQPSFLPWLGFFELIAKSDTFIIYDCVQFEKQSWQQRNRVRNRAGELMLTLPVKHGSGLDRRINEVEIDVKNPLLKKHLQTIHHAYAKAPAFPEMFPLIEYIYNAPPVLLIDMNLALIKLGMQKLNIHTPLVFASGLGVTGTRVEALIDICKKTGAEEYLSPAGSKVYIDENNIFGEHSIKLKYQDFNHPVYRQMDHPDFISHLSFIDYLFNVSVKETEKFGSTFGKRKPA